MMPIFFSTQKILIVRRHLDKNVAQAYMSSPKIGDETTGQFSFSIMKMVFVIFVRKTVVSEISVLKSVNTNYS